MVICIWDLVQIERGWVNYLFINQMKVSIGISPGIEAYPHVSCARVNSHHLDQIGLPPDNRLHTNEGPIDKYRPIILTYLCRDGKCFGQENMFDRALTATVTTGGEKENDDHPSS